MTCPSIALTPPRPEADMTSAELRELARRYERNADHEPINGDGNRRMDLGFREASRLRALASERERTEIAGRLFATAQSALENAQRDTIIFGREFHLTIAESALRALIDLNGGRANA